MENQRKPKDEKGKKAKMKIRKFEEIGKSVEMKKSGGKKRSYWTRAMAWLQQLAPDVTMKLLVKIYQNIYTNSRRQLSSAYGCLPPIVEAPRGVVG